MFLRAPIDEVDGGVTVLIEGDALVSVDGAGLVLGATLLTISLP